MPLPLLKFPFLVQELIIQQIELPKLFEAAIGFKAFKKLLQKMRYPIENMEWYISRDGEVNDSLELTHRNEDDGPSLIINRNAHVQFFNSLENEYADSHNRLKTISTFMLSLFKPQKLCVSIRRKLENLPNFFVWKFSQNFHSTEIVPYDGVIEVSLEDLKFIFEVIKSKYYWIEVQCPAVYEGNIKCEILQISDHLEWVSLENLFSSNCKIRTLDLTQQLETAIKYSIKDFVNKWLTGSNMVLKSLSVSTLVMFEHEMEQFRVERQDEAPAVLKDFNPIPSVLSRQQLQKQCEDENCKGPCWDIRRADGRRATIHAHNSTTFHCDYFYLYIWDHEKLQK